jgi:hypothetical protein
MKPCLKSYGTAVVAITAVALFEPPRVYRRRVDLSYATNTGRSSEA